MPHAFWSPSIPLSLSLTVTQSSLSFLTSWPLFSLSLSLSFLLSHFFIPSIIVYSFVSFSCLTTSFNFTFFFHLCIAPAINSCLIFVSHFSILLLILLCTGAAKHFSLLTSFHSPVYFICNNNYGPILMAQPFQSFTHSGHFSLDLSLSLSLPLTSHCLL